MIGSFTLTHYRGAGYKTLLLAVYKTSLFWPLLKCEVKNSDLSRFRPSVFFQIWLFIRPHLNLLPTIGRL